MSGHARRREPATVSGDLRAGPGGGPAPPSASSPWTALVRELPFVLACVALSLWIYRSALGAYFSPDDLTYLERVRGIVSQPPTLWRYLSGVAYFQVTYPLFGAHPVPYFLVNWLLHGLTVASIYAWVRAYGGGVLAATLAAALFGTSRLHLTVVAQVVTVAEPLAMVLAMAALAMTRRNGWVWLLGGLVMFSAALLCKETVLLLPLVLLLPGPLAGPLRARALRYAALMVPSLLIIGYMSDPRTHDAIFVNDIYQRAYGINLFHKLMMLTGWAFDMQTPTPDLSATLSTTAWHASLWITLGLLVLGAVAWRSTTLPALGVAWWLLTLAPVLPLLKQHYQHYLYVPMAGLAMALGSGLEWALRVPHATRRPMSAPAAKPARGSSRARGPARSGGLRSALGWGLAAAIILGHVALSEGLLEQRSAPRLARVDLPVDPFLRKAETARRVVTSVGQSIGGRRMSAVFVVPESGWTWKLAEILHSILGEGRALRAVYPNLDSVAMVPRWSTAYRDFELFYGRVDGKVVDVGRGPEAHLRLARLLIADRCGRDARDNLAAALMAYPDDARLKSLYAQVAADARVGTEPRR
jgi:hypothetical protein